MVPQHPPPAQHPPLASWGSRAKALALDSLMLLVPAVLLFLVLVVPELGDTTPDGEADLGGFVAFVAFLALMLLVGIVWALHVVLMMIRKGERTARRGESRWSGSARCATTASRGGSDRPHCARSC